MIQRASRWLQVGFCIACAATVISAVFAFSASASTLGPFHDAIAGPAFVGDSIAIAQLRGAGEAIVVRTDATGATQDVGRVPRIPGLALTLAGSPSLLAVRAVGATCTDVECHYQEFDTTANEVLTAAPGQPFSCLAGFDPTRRCAIGTCPVAGPSAEPVAVSGTSVAYLASCQGGLVVADVATGARKIYRAGPQGVPFPEAEPSQGRFAIAGPWLVTVTVDPGSPMHTHAFLIDRRSGGTVFEATHSFITAVSVQDDGTMVYEYNDVGATPSDIGPSRLAWVSPADAVAHDIAQLPGLGPFSVRIARGLIVVTESDSASTSFVVYDLAGHVVAQATPTALHAIGGGDLGWDFDGQRVAWLASPCHVEGFVQLWNLGQPPPSDPDQPCPAAIPFGPIIATNRRLTVSLSCPDQPPLGCNGQLLVEARIRDHRRAYRRGAFRLLGVATIDTPPGTTRSIEVTLNRADRHWLARHRNVGARARVITVKAAGQDDRAPIQTARADLPLLRR